MSKEIVPEVELNLFEGDGFNMNDIMSQMRGEDNRNQEQDTLPGNQNPNSFNTNDVDEWIEDEPKNKEDMLDAVRQQVNGEVEEEGAGTKPVVEEQKPLSEEAYSLMFDFIKEQGILNIPDDIEVLDEEKLQWVIDQNNQSRNQAALDYVRSQAGDEKVLEIFDIAYGGGTWDDIKNMRELIEVEDNYEALDVTSEQDQRFLIENYLKEGLDPNNPANKRRLAGLNEEVEKYMERLEGENMATEAKTYFVDKINKEKDKLHAEKEERVRLEKEQQVRAAQAEAKWIDDFKTSLDQRKWAGEKKKAVIQQFDIVKLDNGTETELWRYKVDQMWKKPELVHHLMDFLSQLDPYTMSFKGETLTPEKNATKRLLEMAQKKASAPGGQGKNVVSRQEFARQNENKPQGVIDPRQF
jgi:hypothetical protein